MSSTATPVACHACGTALVPGAPFCVACGARGRPAVAETPAGGSVTPAVTAKADPLGGVVPAAPGRRLAAFVVDQLAGAVVYVVAVVLAGAMAGGSSSSGVASTTGALGLLAGPLVAVAIFGLAQLLWEGRAGKTVGNATLGIRTIAVQTGRAPGVGRAFVRRLVEAAGGLVVLGSYVVVVSAAWDHSRARQGWQDKAAGTTMVGARSGAPVASPSAAAVPAAAQPSRSVATPPSVGATPSVTAPPSAAALPSATPGTGPATRVLPPTPPAQPSGGVAPALASPAPVVPEAPAARRAPARRPGALIADVPGFDPEPEEQPALPGPVREDDIEHTQLRPPRALGGAGYRLEFDTGERVTVVTGTGLIGRNPAPAGDETVDQLVTITDPDRSVSKTHLKFGVGPDGFWVLDRGSTNGTWTVSPEGARAEVPRGVPVPVPVTSTVEFGDRRFTVSAG